MFPALNFVRICLFQKMMPKNQGKRCANAPNPKRAWNVLNLSDKMKISDLEKDGKWKLTVLLKKINQLSVVQYILSSSNLNMSIHSFSSTAVSLELYTQWIPRLYSIYFSIIDHYFIKHIMSKYSNRSYLDCVDYLENALKM
jgi:hypothetical protein